MKKSIFTLLVLFSVIFASCHQPVFYTIMQDVPPQDATISGDISSITRYTVNGQEYLVTNAQQGLLYKKTFGEDSHGNWKTYNNLPFSLPKFDYYGSGWSGEKIIKTVADSTYLYIVTCKIQTDKDEGINYGYDYSIWYKQITDFSESSGAWSKVNTNVNGSTLLYSYFDRDENFYQIDFNVFCTNNESSSNRKAYVRNNESGKIYLLNGANVSLVSSPKILGSNGKIDSATYFNGQTYFFDSVASVSSSKAIYWAEGSNLYYSLDGTTTNHALDAGIEISCLAATSDALLIGRGNFSQTDLTASNGGITKTQLNSQGVPSSELGKFSTNAQTQLSSNYLICTLLVTDSQKTELNSCIYSSITFRYTGTSVSVSYDNKGLWSYYPERGNWNRE